MKKYFPKITVFVLALFCFSMTSFAALSAEGAKDIAAKAVPASAVFLAVETDSDEYEVKFKDENGKTLYSVDVSKAASKVTEVKTKNIFESGSVNVSLSEQDVMNIVKQAYPDATITKVKLDRDNGLYEYEVKFVTPLVWGEVELNPQTGAVLETELVLR